MVSVTEILPRTSINSEKRVVSNYELLIPIESNLTLKKQII